MTKTTSIPSEQVRSITGYAEEQTITIRANIYDVPGNETIGAESTTELTIEETSPSITYVSYRSNFSDTTLATVGHEITVTLRTNEAIQNPTATISSNTTNIIDLGGDAWHCKYEMQDSDSDGIFDVLDVDHTLVGTGSLTSEADEYRFVGYASVNSKLTSETIFIQ